MTRERFDQLVRHIEGGVGRHPTALHRRVMLLACAGYGGLLAWLLMVFLLSGLCFAAIEWVDDGKIILAVLGLAMLSGGGFSVIRAMLVQVPPPEGRPVTRSQVPQLFALLDDLQKQLDSPPFHRVLIDFDCNAAVRQLPRLGVFGWSRNYLNIGLPLLHGLSVDQMRAVLAHEFAHLSRQHGRSSHRLYRLRRSWEDIFKQLSTRPRERNEVSMRRMLVWYFEWFWPRFNAYAVVLSRANECQADASAAEVAGTPNMAGCLVEMEILARQLEERFWPDLLLSANQQPEPPADVFRRLEDCLRAGPSREDRVRWTQEALRVATTNEDTHPCLAERLRALHQLDSFAGDWERRATEKCAAEVLLGTVLSGICSDVTELWRKEIAPKWHDRHALATSLAHRLTCIGQAVPDAAADVDSMWERSAALLGLNDKAGAEKLLRQILSLAPSHVRANLQLGRLLLEDGHAEGEAYLQTAMYEDEQTIPEACSWLHEHYRRTGQTGRLRELAGRLDRHEKEVIAAAIERREVTTKDILLAHGLADNELMELRQVLIAEPELTRAFLAQKNLQFCPKQKLFVLCVRRFRPWYRLPNRQAEQGMVERLSRKISLPGRVLVFPPRGSFRALAHKLQNVPGAEVLRRYEVHAACSDTTCRFWP